MITLRVNRWQNAHGDSNEAKTDFEQARTYLSRGLAISHEFVDMDAALGMAEYQLRDCQDALPHLQQAQDFAFYRVAALKMTGICYETLNEQTQALGVFRQIETEGIPYPHGWFELGDDATRRGDDAAGIQFFRRVVAVAPDNVGAFANLAMAQRRTGDSAGSLLSAESCLRLDPNLVPCLVVAADDLVRLGRPTEAMPLFERAKHIKR